MPEISLMTSPAAEEHRKRKYCYLLLIQMEGDVCRGLMCLFCFVLGGGGGLFVLVWVCCNLFFGCSFCFVVLFSLALNIYQCKYWDFFFPLFFMHVSMQSEIQIAAFLYGSFCSLWGQKKSCDWNGSRREKKKESIHVPADTSHLSSLDMLKQKNLWSPDG